MTTITDAVQAKLEAIGFVGIQQVLPYGQSEHGFTLHFNRPVDADMLADLQAVKVEIVEPGDQVVHVLVPADWLPTAESDVEVKSTPAPDSSDKTAVRVDKSAVAPLIIECIKTGLVMIGCDGDDLIITHLQASDYEIVAKSDFLDLPLTCREIKNRVGFLEVSATTAGGLVVKVPSKWEVDAWIALDTTEVHAVSPDLAEAIAEDEAWPANVADPELPETARRIKDLQHEVAQLIAANERLQAERDELIEQRDSAIAMASVADDLRAEDVERALEGRALITMPCKEVKTHRNISDSDLQKALNEGWDILHIQFTDTALNVVFTRESVTPTSPNPMRAARKLVEAVGPSMVIMTPPTEPAYGGSMEDRLNKHRALLQRRDLTWEQKRAEMNKSLFEAGNAAYQTASATYTPPASPFNKEG